MKNNYSKAKNIEKTMTLFYIFVNLFKGWLDGRLLDF